MQSMIKVVFFDVGGVLLKQDSNVFDVFDKMNGFQSGESVRLWTEYLHQAHTGKIFSPQQYYQFPQITNLKNKLYETNKPTRGIIRILNELSASLRLGVISNFTPDLDDVLKQIGVYDFFEHVINSSQVGIKKPSPEIYNVSCSKFNILPSEAIFVDDNSRNVEAAQDFGMNGILFTGSDSLETALRQYSRNT